MLFFIINFFFNGYGFFRVIWKSGGVGVLGVVEGRRVWWFGRRSLRVI